MKLINKITSLLVASLVFTACERDYDAPPLNEPKYEGPAANTTIAQLRELGAAATKDAPVILSGEKILKAVVSANDLSGNIFKKIYFQDETGGIEMGVDQNSVYNYYPVGQEVYIHLDGLSISVYGEEQQLGHPDGYLYRTPWVDFEAHVHKSSWANPANVQAIVLDDISAANADVSKYKFKLVTLTGVKFDNGGKNTFAPAEGYGEEYLKDIHGNSIMARTSNYANFASEKLPAGRGNVTGILGRFNGSWQLTIRSIDDVAGFTGESEEPEQPEQTEKKIIFSESFGKAEKVNGNWPLLKDFQNLDNKDVTFEDGGVTSVRMNEGNSNIWFPTGKDIVLAIKGIKGGEATTATLEYEAGANTYNDGEQQDLNTLKVRCNGQELNVPSKLVSGQDQGNKPNKIIIENVPVSANTTLEFYTTAATNTHGLRLFDVKLYTKSGTGSGNTGGGTPIEPTPTH